MSAAGDLMNDQVDLAFNTITTDSEFGKINTPNVVQTGVLCRIQIGISTKSTDSGQYSLENSGKVYFDGIMPLVQQSVLIWRSEFNHGPRDRYLEVVGVKVTDEVEVFTTAWVQEYDPFATS